MDVSYRKVCRRFESPKIEYNNNLHAENNMNQDDMIKVMMIET